MSLETAADAHRIRALSRAEYNRLLAYLEQLPPEGWSEQSAASEWKVYQVVSHLGSQPEIHAGILQAGLRGAPPMTDQQRQAIWGYFDSLGPHDVLPAFKKNNDAYVELAESLTDDELARQIPWLGREAPIAVVIASRLNEQVLHDWDIRWARDGQARLWAEAVPSLLELNLTPQRLGGLAKPDRAPGLAGKSVQFMLREPAAQVAIDVAADGVGVRQGRADNPALTVELPAEAFIRLIWGRYDVKAGQAAGELKLDHPELVDDLQALFPGR